MKAKANLIKSVLGFFLAAICITYPQQIGGGAMKIVSFIADIIVKVITGPILKVIGA